MEPGKAQVAYDQAAHLQALQAAYREQLRTLLTEPLTLGHVADYFDMGRNNAAKLVKLMPEAERIGGKWRLPLFWMTPKYLAERGLIGPARPPE